MAAPEASSKPATFSSGAPRVELSTAVLQHFWGDLLDNLHRVEHDGAEIEIDTATAKGFILALYVGELITEVQRNLMHDLLSEAREAALRRTRRHTRG
jgi:hypothetical protein